MMGSEKFNSINQLSGPQCLISIAIIIAREIFSAVKTNLNTINHFVAISVDQAMPWAQIEILFIQWVRLFKFWHRIASGQGMKWEWKL